MTGRPLHEQNEVHVPAMVREVIDVFSPNPGGRYIDLTLGDGGHAEAVLKATGSQGKLLGIERDPMMLERAKKRLEPFGERAVLVNANYVDVKRLAERHGFMDSDGALFDLGVASWHFDAAGRGFSFRSEEPLDMRYNPEEGGSTAAEIINHAERQELQKIFKELGEEPEAEKIANAIVKRRPIASTRMLADIIRQAKRQKTRIHPATRVFQALRIAVNDELVSLETALPESVRTLKLGGMLVVIAYHSLEDRIVKHFMREEVRQGRLSLVFVSPLTAGQEELAENPRVRSAKLRAARRI